MFQEGQQIGERYVVEALLGEGGLARVYRVRHLQLGTLHALKHLYLSRPGLQERLLQEGRIQARLQHPHVVRVQDVLDLDGQPGLLMEFVPGSSLHELIGSGGALPLDEGLDLFSQVLSGVAAAHRQGVLHRDLKPANILLTQGASGWVAKVADFGLAKVTDDGEMRGRTRAGISMGTPGYMAPEQVVSAADVDQRADIFALGVVLYELLVGKAPFGVGDDFSILSETVHGRYVPIDEALEGCPDEVRAAVTRALAAERDDRFETCEAFAEELFRGRPALLAPVMPQPGEARPSLPVGASPAVSVPTIGGSLLGEVPSSGAQTAPPSGATMVPEGGAAGATLAPTASMLEAPATGGAGVGPTTATGAKRPLWPVLLGVGVVFTVLIGVVLVAGGSTGLLIANRSTGDTTTADGGQGAEDALAADDGSATVGSASDRGSSEAPAGIGTGPVPEAPGSEAAAVADAGAGAPVEGGIRGSSDSETPRAGAELAEGASGVPQGEGGRASAVDPQSMQGDASEDAATTEDAASTDVASEGVASEDDASEDEDAEAVALVEPLAVEDEATDATSSAASSPEPEAAPAPSPPALTGTWRGEANGRPLTLRITSQDGNALAGEVSFLAGATERVVAVRGAVDARGRLTLRENDGTELVFSGVAASTSIGGEYMRKGQKKALSWNVEKQ